MNFSQRNSLFVCYGYIHPLTKRFFQALGEHQLKQHSEVSHSINKQHLLFKILVTSLHISIVIFVLNCLFISVLHEKFLKCNSLAYEQRIYWIYYMKTEPQLLYNLATPFQYIQWKYSDYLWISIKSQKFFGVSTFSSYF